MQKMEREAIEEEGMDCQSFLTVCRVALPVFPPEACGLLMYPLQLLMGNMSLATLLAISPQSSTATGEPAPETPCLTMSVVPASKQQCHSSREEATRPASTKGPTQWKLKEGKFLAGLKENCQEAFCRDSNLIQSPNRGILRYITVLSTRRDPTTSVISFGR